MTQRKMNEIINQKTEDQLELETIKIDRDAGARRDSYRC